MEFTAEVEITPKILAAAFWNMGSKEQAEFFEELGKEIAGDTYHSQMQWFYLKAELCKSTLAKDTFMDMAAPMFWQTLKYMETK